jgi:uncharacterized protein
LNSTETARAAATVPVTREDDEATRVSLRQRPPVTPAANKGAAHPSQTPLKKRQVIVPLPEETWVAGEQKKQKRGTGLWKWVAALSGVIILASLAIILYYLTSDNGNRARTQNNRAVAKATPRTSPSPTPTANANLSNNTNTDNLNSQPASPEQMAAREKLARKNIPYDEGAFADSVKQGDPETVQLFLDAGMSPDVKDSGGRPLIVSAASDGSDNISRKLLARRADINARDAGGSTALMYAAENDHKGTIKVLLENNTVDLDATDNRGQTALMRAAVKGRSEVVRMLINRGARTDIKDNTGRDALTWAETNNQSDVVEVLKKAGGR